MGLLCPICGMAVFKRDPDNVVMLCEDSHPVTLETFLVGEGQLAGFTLSATEHIPS